MGNFETNYKHIIINEKGIPYIKDTTTKVIDIVSEYISYGWSPEEIHLQHDYLSPGQIYSALAYYWDNKASLDKELEIRKDRISKIRDTFSTQLLQDKLRTKKAI